MGADAGGRERGGRRSPVATASAAGRGGVEAGRREAVESSEAARAASGLPRGWCSQEAAAAVVPAAGGRDWRRPPRKWAPLGSWAGPPVARERGRWAGQPALPA